MKDFTYIVELKKTISADNEDEARDLLYEVIEHNLCSADILEAECVEEGRSY